MSSSHVSFDVLLRACFGGILATACGAAMASCSSGPVACGGCGCGSADATAPYNITYAVCAAVTDAAVEAGDGGVVDAGACFTTCLEACGAMKPASDPGFGSCVSSNDAGAGQTGTATCQALVQCTGRKLDGLAAPHVEASNALGAWLAQAAWLEAASVHAFIRLARELDAHGAPRELALQAKACARDEVRHARMMTKLAHAHGAQVPKVTIERLPLRNLESIAKENAIEGCVGETYGALQAAWRASTEQDPRIASAMRAIAPDELRHAAFGWSVAAWLDTKLTLAERTRVLEARTAAAHAIIESAPTPSERTLATELMHRLWAA